MAMRSIVTSYSVSAYSNTTKMMGTTHLKTIISIHAEFVKHPYKNFWRVLT